MSEQTFTQISELGEFGLLDRILGDYSGPKDEATVVGLGDDAAVYRVRPGHVHVISTDALIEGVHFDRTFNPLNYLGTKSISVNASDIVAMNALPKYATISLGVPNKMSVEMLEELYTGISSACEAYGIELIGGDTTGARDLMISITVVGESEEEHIVTRSGAQVGDLLCVTGDLGSAYAGLKILLGRRAKFKEKGDDFEADLEPFSYVIQRQLTPRARLDRVLAWRDRGFKPTAMIDISDGLASEVGHICRRSSVGGIIRESLVPVHEMTKSVADHTSEKGTEYALVGGEDYELLVTVPSSAESELEELGLTKVGEILPASEGINLERLDGEVSGLDPKGYQHF